MWAHWWQAVAGGADETWPRWAVTITYFAVLAIVCVYGMHRWWLVYLFYKHRRRLARPAGHFEKLPRLTVQLPMFNESRVAQRIIDAACALDYPRHLLQIQVLDDSTDDSAAIARQRVEYWQAQGRDIQYLHRTHRQGFKAGALADALPAATGEFVAIFDADFVPPPQFLRQTLDFFTDPAVGMVQTRWDHLNRDDSWLTRSEAIFLDGHFVIEHTARHRSDRWINFNGTAGMWRKRTIADAGGWQHDTLTEDVDLSYRAQLRGWRFIYLPGVGCPAEVPPTIAAFKSQQHRWTKGSIQTARKLLGQLLSAPIPLRVKVEAFFHLTAPLMYLMMTIMAMLFYPVIAVSLQPFAKGSLGGLVLGLSLFTLGTVSASSFYLASQQARGRSVWKTFLQLPILMSIGVGIAVNNARACLEALLGYDSPFVRTPKYGSDSKPAGRELDDPAEDGVAEHLRRYLPSAKFWVCVVELGLGFYMLACLHLVSQVDRTFISLPFLCLFAAGYFYVGIQSLWNLCRGMGFVRRLSMSTAG